MLILWNEKMKSADVADVAPMLVISNIGIKKGFHSFSFYRFADVAEVKKKCIVYIVLFFIQNEQMNEREKSGFLKGVHFFASNIGNIGKTAIKPLSTRFYPADVGADDEIHADDEHRQKESP